MIKKFLSLLALIMMLSGTAFASSVTDSAGLLGAEEIELLNQRIRNVEQAHKVKIGISFVRSVEGRDMAAVSDALLDQNFANGMNGGIVLLVAMDKRKYELSTDRRMVERITDFDGIPFLKDKFQSALSSGNYYVAASDFIDGVDELLTYYEEHGFAYDRRAPEAFDPMAAAMSVALSLFLGVMIRSSLIGKMSNVRHAQAAIDYLCKDTIKLTENRDTFLFMNVQRRARGGGSGSSGGSGHSGGHGGGGGNF